MHSITRTIPYNDTLKSLGDAVVDLTEEQKESIKKEDYISALENDHSTLILENHALKNEIQELKERLAEIDEEFGDIYYGSDRGNTMRNEGTAQNSV